MSSVPTLQPREHLSLSTLLSFARCPRRFFYQKCGLVDKRPAPALSYGVAMHLAFPIAMIDGLDAAVEAFKSVWDESIADDKRNLSHAIASLQHFVFTHQAGKAIYGFVKPPVGDMTLDTETSEWEVPFAIDIGLPVPLVGRIDGLVKHRDTGDLWGLEFKTMGRMTGYTMEAFEMHPQLLTYTLALKTVTEQPIVGFMVEAMLVDKKKVDGMTHLVHIMDHHVDDIYQWLHTLGASLLAMEEQSMALAKAGEDPAGPFIKDFSGCTAYPSFWIPSFRCDFTNLCRPPDWRQAVCLYDVSTERTSGFDAKTKGSRECPV